MEGLRRVVYRAVRCRFIEGRVADGAVAKAAAVVRVDGVSIYLIYTACGERSKPELIAFFTESKPVYRAVLVTRTLVAHTVLGVIQYIPTLVVVHEFPPLS